MIENCNDFNDAKFGFRPLIIVFVVCVLVSSCLDSDSPSVLREGDLLFQDLDCGDLCDAIETVTQGVDGKDFSHCGMIVAVQDTLMVVEAIGNGVQLNTLADFYQRSGDKSATITVGRFKDEFRSLIEKASRFALGQVGESYDEPFHLNNDKWYCSELLYESYKWANQGEQVFQLAPMTFKDPTTNEYFPAWVEYYEGLGEDIPEGELGLNPGSISRSNKIEIIQVSW